MIQAYGHDVHIVCKNMAFALRLLCVELVLQTCPDTMCWCLCHLYCCHYCRCFSRQRGSRTFITNLCGRVSKCHHHHHHHHHGDYHDRHHHHHLFNRVVVGTVRVGGSGEFEPQPHVCQSKPKRCHSQDERGQGQACWSNQIEMSSSSNPIIPTGRVGVGDVCFFLTMRCFPILNDAMFWTMFFNF